MQPLRQIRQKSRTEDLPEVCGDGSWRDKVITALCEWMGCQQDVWGIDGHTFRDALKRICEGFYGSDVDFGLEDVESDKVTKQPAFVKSAAFAVVSFLFFQMVDKSNIVQATQRITEWRSTFGSTAIAVVSAFFDNEKHAERFSTNESRSALATNQLQYYRFIFAEAEGNDPKVSTFKLYIRRFNTTLRLLYRNFMAAFTALLSEQFLLHTSMLSLVPIRLQDFTRQNRCHIPVVPSPCLLLLYVV
jgi:hypothetical protein